MPPTPSVLIPEARLQARVRELAAAIDRDRPAGGTWHLVGTLKGAFMFLADLMRALGSPATCDFLAVSSYAGATESGGRIRVVKDLDQDIAGRDVLLVEDIVDTGLTLWAVQSLLASRRPRTLRTVALLDKRARRRVDVVVDYAGFRIEDRFVVGYGLDLDEQYRGLPYVGVLEEG
jgi:hypoxanthine phosphoribosyltransferase